MNSTTTRYRTTTFEVAATDGASNPDYKVSGELEYDADNVGGYIGNVDTSTLLPYQRLTARVFGELANQSVDQSFDFDAGESMGTPH